MKTEKVVNEFDDQSVNRLLNNYQNKQINKKNVKKRLKFNSPTAPRSNRVLESAFA